MKDSEFYSYLNNVEKRELKCCICHNPNIDDDFICDRCDEYYCEDCSYSFTLHYQFQGSRCYKCADQSRRKKLTKDEIANNDAKFRQIIIDKILKDE